MRVLAVDFGTSNTVAAVAADGAPPRTLTIDGSPLLPSSVFLTDDGNIAVGRDADRQARLDPSRYEPNPKRRIDDGDILLGSEVIAVRQAIAAVLGRVSQEFQRQNAGNSPDVVRLTHPARWRQARKDVLVAAAQDAGLGQNPILVPEPVGAATHFAMQSGHTMAPGSALAVYDLGGGTFDVAIVQKRGEGFEVVAEAGLPDLGGLDFDHAIWEQIGRSQGRQQPEEWTKLNRPTDTASRRAQRALAVDVKEGKEALSRNPHTDIALPDPFSDAHLTRSEFEELIRPNLARSVELLATTISEAGFTPSQLVGVYLVGGSSRIPLVARLIQEGLGITPTTLDQPEVTVVSGALFLNVNPRLPEAPQFGQRNAPVTGVAPMRPPTNATQVHPQTGATQLPPQTGVTQVRPQTGATPLPPQTGATPYPQTGATPRPPQPTMPQAGIPQTQNRPVARPPQPPPTLTPTELPALNTFRTTSKPPANVRSLAAPPQNQPPPNQQRPQTSPQQMPRPVTVSVPPQPRPAAQAPQRQPVPAQAAAETNWQPIIWAGLIAIAAVLIAVLIANLT